MTGTIPEGQPANGRSAEYPTIQRLGERVLSHAKGDRRQVRVVRWSEFGHFPTLLSICPSGSGAVAGEMVKAYALRHGSASPFRKNIYIEGNATTVPGIMHTPGRDFSFLCRYTLPR